MFVLVCLCVMCNVCCMCLHRLVHLCCVCSVCKFVCAHYVCVVWIVWYVCMWHMCGVVCLCIPKEAKENMTPLKLHLSEVVDNHLLVLVVEN